MLDKWRAGTAMDKKVAAAQPFIDLVIDDSMFDLLTGGFGADLFA